MSDSNAKKLAQLLGSDSDIKADDTDFGASTDSIGMPAGTQAERPTLTNSQYGHTRFNTDVGSLEFWDGSNWVATNLIPEMTSVSGTIYNGLASTLTINIGSKTDEVDIVFSDNSGTFIAEVTGLDATSSVSTAVPSSVYGAVSVGDVIRISSKNQDGTPSSNFLTETVVDIPTGGTITTSGDYRIHTFTSSGTLAVPTGFSVAADYVVSAGGGGGGGGNPGSALGGGGGGGGGLVESTTTLASATNYTMTIGAGGAGDSTGSLGNADQGSNSSAFGTTAIGGGGGGTRNGVQDGDNGGSGGGACGNYPTQGSAGTGTSGQGNPGGENVSTDPNHWGAGGGGGKGTAGGNVNSNTNGDGGDGVNNNWASGSNIVLAGGGGGGRNNGGGSGNTGGAGSESAGDGADIGELTGEDAPVSRSGGGGGCGSVSGNNVATTRGGNGGGGRIIVRYDVSGL